MNNLLDFLAKTCLYAQDHIQDPDGWSEDEIYREDLLQCTSYTVACFLSQNTVQGDQGVEFDVVLEELADNTKDKRGLMIKTEKQWQKIIAKKVKALGGFKR